MNIIEIIDKKRTNNILTDEEIRYVINGYLSGEIADYQMSALLMAIVINGMNFKEIESLTETMVASGEKLNLSYLGAVVDKHSTGGVGDKTTLIVAPLVASCGVKVAKMSGRGLGFTGGTIDKLESIPGFITKIPSDKFIEQVNDIGLAIISQTENLVPADKKIYALRDVTGTVESNALIASSIMSKKIASGTNKLVLDIKVGKGALIKNIESARTLAKIMIELGISNNMAVTCLLTNMDIPLGNNVGNSLEVLEAIDVLKNKKQGKLTELCIEIAANMVSLSLNIPIEQSKNSVINNLNNGRAYQKFVEFINYQKGDLNKLPKANNIYELISNKEGYLTNIDALKLGKFAMELGAGRHNKEDKIDYAAGVIINKNINDYINKGDAVLTIHTNKEISSVDETIFTISNDKLMDNKIIYEIIR